MARKEEFGTKKISTLLKELAIPAIFAMLVSLLYNMVDRIYIGNMPNGTLGMAGLFKIKIIPYLLISLTARIPSVASSVICGAFAFQKQYTLSLLILGVSLIVTGIFALIGHVWLKKKQKTPAL